MQFELVTAKYTELAPSADQISKQVIIPLLRLQHNIQTVESTLHFLVDGFVGVGASLAVSGAEGSVASISVLTFAEMEAFPVVGGGRHCPVCSWLAQRLYGTGEKRQ